MVNGRRYALLGKNGGVEEEGGEDEVNATGVGERVPEMPVDASTATAYRPTRLSRRLREDSTTPAEGRRFREDGATPPSEVRSTPRDG